ncbi:MAG: helix-turn-helix domain-containing protein [Candidatus Heritagella sp.]
MKQELETFCFNVTWLRKNNHISRKRMAELLEISEISLAKIEKGKIPPRLSVKVLFRIQSVFRILPKDQVERRLG